MAAKKEQPFQWSREARRVQVLGADNLRVFDHKGYAWTLNGRNPNAAADLQALLADVRGHDADCAERIYSELPDVWRERADLDLTTADDEDEVIR
jgi:hypothetical protein